MLYEVYAQQAERDFKGLKISANGVRCNPSNERRAAASKQGSVG